MRTLGLDYGTKRIGVALSAPWGTMAHPLDTIMVRADDGHFNEINKLIKEYDVERVVVGMPYNMDGTVGESGERALAFAEKVREVSGLEVVMWDERLTTSEAHSMMIDMNVKGKKRRQVVDKIAASLILSGYLESLQ